MRRANETPSHSHPAITAQFNMEKKNLFFLKEIKLSIGDSVIFIPYSLLLLLLSLFACFWLLETEDHFIAPTSFKYSVL